MVQYLFAAFSLGGTQIDSDDHQSKAARWRRVITDIAREEMGHLVTVENLLRLIGGPLTFDREDYPIPADLYPFPFELRPLSRESLARYVLAESPDDQTLEKLGLTKEMEEIRRTASYGGAGGPVNRVGIIYAAIEQLFTLPTDRRDPPDELTPYVHSSDIQAATRGYQARAEEWGLNYDDLKIETASNRDEALAAIQAISLQGEGSSIEDLPTSHFGRFLEVYRDFPKDEAWRPSRKVAANPTTDSKLEGEGRNVIQDPEADLWAGLANLRYRILLVDLMHAFLTERPPDSEKRSPRGLLISWSFGEMYQLRCISDILMSLPLKAGGELLAGPPFEMPYSLALPDREPDRWRLHRDLLLASRQYNSCLQKLPTSHASYLRSLEEADQKALEQVELLIGN
jgi:rubrerythrin